jgi:hypothetical protein
VLGVPGKLVKYVVHSSKKKLKKLNFSSHKLPKLQSTSFWFQGILGIKITLNVTKCTIEELGAILSQLLNAVNTILWLMNDNGLLWVT